MHSTATHERAPDPEPAVAAATALARSPAAVVRSLQHRVGNRAVARFIGPALREARFRSLIGSEAATKGQFLFNGKVAECCTPRSTPRSRTSRPCARSSRSGKPRSSRRRPGRTMRRPTPPGPSSRTRSSPPTCSGPTTPGSRSAPGCSRPSGRAYSDSKKGFPDLTPYVNLAHFQALARYELIACKRTATLIAGRYVAGGGGGGTRSAGTAIKPTQLIGSVKTDMAVFGGDLSLGTVATYSGELGKEVERMKRAIDDGWVIHARVLSGIEGGGKSRAETEHSIIVYGYSGNAFEYFDPDVGGSNVATTGFDRLHYDAKANRLSTAASEADFAVYAHRTNEPGHIRGYQVSGVHRYQVSSIETL